MFSSNYAMNYPSQESPGEEAPPPMERSPGLPLVTSDIQDEPLPPAITSDLVQLSEKPPRANPAVATHAAHSPSRTSAQPSLDEPGSHSRPTNPVTTPGRSRIEIVLNISPHKHAPGQQLWTNVDDDSYQDGQTRTSKPAASSRKRPRNPNPVYTSAPLPLPGERRSRGRPKGWRPGMPSTKTGLPTASTFKQITKDTGQRVAPTAPMPTGQKRRGRPPRAPSPTPREIWETMTPPKYVPFICEWRGCKAELHNAETLRRHISVVHARAAKEKPLLCRWGDSCRRELTQGYELMGHMDTEHLLSLVWHVGDGHRNGKCLARPTKDEEESGPPAYLLGADGELVVPWVRDQELEDLLTWRENRRRLKEILLQRDANAPPEEEDDQSQLEAAADDNLE